MAGAWPTAPTLGGSSGDVGYAIAVDSAGAAYVTGWTNSGNFPTTPESFQPTMGGQPDTDVDAFVAKVTPDGSGLAYSTYLGGSGNDYGNAIAVDSTGAAYVTGKTFSTDFPFQTTYQGGLGAFVVKVKLDGRGLGYATYLGGNVGVGGAGIAVDSTGAAYVTGVTSSTNFPTTPGAFQTTNQGDNDAFVVKLPPFIASGILSSVAIGDHSVLFALGTDLGIWRLDPSTGTPWIEISQGTGQQFVQLSAGSDGNGQADVFAVTTTRSLWKFDSQFAPGGFQVDAPGFVRQVSATQDNWAIALGTDGQIYSYNGLGFGAGARFLMTYIKSPFIPGPPYLAVSASNDQAGRIGIFAITSGHALVQVNADGTTTPLSGSEKIQQISAGRDSQGNVDAFAVSTAGALFKFDSVNAYFQADGPGQVQKVSAALADWGIVLDPTGAVYSYNGKGQGQGARFLMQGPGTAVALTADTDSSGLNVFYVTPGGAFFEIRPDGTLVALPGLTSF